MTRTRVKICGITQPEDALAAVSAGVDAIGLVFYANSPRYIQLDMALEICRIIPPLVTTVGLFVDHSKDEVERVIERIPLDLLQFHGNEDDAFCASFNRPYIKALRVRDKDSLERDLALYPAAQGFLLDTYVKGIAGGTGERFDWQLIPESVRSTIILAGGLGPDNVSDAISAVTPYAVDVSGGVEASPGIKSHRLIEEFMAAVGRR
ncbi:MAG: phosphoribosylanthranilate isomerase [Pseudomonadales bacterium]